MTYRLGYFAQALALLLLCGGATVATAQSQQQGNNENVNIQQFQDWDVRCPEKRSAEKRCEMTQLVNGSSGKPILRAVMGYPPQLDSAAMIFVLPLGTRLAPGVQLSVDGD